MNAFALSEAATLPAVWDELYRRVSPEAVAVEVYRGPGPAGIERLTYKELNANAHCLAAYLLAKGLQPGARVLIVSGAQAQLVLLDLAAQLAGGVAAVASPQLPLGRFERVLQLAQPAVVLVAELATYRRLQPAFEAFIARGADAAAARSAAPFEVIVAARATDEALEADRATLLERAIELGKVHWREHTAAVRAAKAAVRPEADAVWFVAESGAPTALSHAQLTDAGRRAAAALTALGPTERVLCLVQPQAPLGRVALLLTLAGGLPLLLAEHPRRVAAAIGALRPTVLVALPRGLAALLHRLLPRRGALARYWARALAASSHRHQLLSQGQRVPLGVRLRHAAGQALFYRPLRRRALASLHTVLVPPQGLDGATRHTLEQLGLPLTTELGGQALERWVQAQPAAQAAVAR